MSDSTPPSDTYSVAPLGEEGEPLGRRSLLVPLLLAAVILATIGFTLVHYTYHKTFADGAILSTIVFPIHRDPAKAAIQLVGAKGEDFVYLLPVVQIKSHINLPIFVESMEAEVTTADGDTFQDTAAQSSEFRPMYDAYPALLRMQQLSGESPLQRDAQINNTEYAHGLVMVHFPITEDAWQHRQSASLTIHIYHQPPLVIPFPANQ